MRWLQGIVSRSVSVCYYFVKMRLFVESCIIIQKNNVLYTKAGLFNVKNL